MSKKPMYVRFDTPEELAEKVYECIEMARNTGGKVRKGVNETTKSIERGRAKFVVIAEDVKPEEIVAHVPLLCEEKGVPYAYVPEKARLGKAAGIDVADSTVSIEDPAEAAELMNAIIERVKKIKSGETE